MTAPVYNSGAIQSVKNLKALRVCAIYHHILAAMVTVCLSGWAG